nr:hypothetical protein [Novosphingobium panipatense]
MAKVGRPVAAPQDVGLERHQVQSLALRAGFDKLSLSGVGLRPGKPELALLR